VPLGLGCRASVRLGSGASGVCAAQSRGGFAARRRRALAKEAVSPTGYGRGAGEAGRHQRPILALPVVARWMASQSTPSGLHFRGRTGESLGVSAGSVHTLSKPAPLHPLSRRQLAYWRRGGAGLRLAIGKTTGRGGGGVHVGRQKVESTDWLEWLRRCHRSSLPAASLPW
jgi:hypothetical protein